MYNHHAILNSTKGRLLIVVCSIRFRECWSLSPFIVFYSMLTRLLLTSKDLLTTYLLTYLFTY